MPDMGGFFAVICKGGAQMRNYCIYSQRKCTQEVFLHLFPEEVHRGFFASIPRGSALRRFSFASVPRGSANRRVFCIYSQRKCKQEGFLYLFPEEVHTGGFFASIHRGSAFRRVHSSIPRGSAHRRFLHLHCDKSIWSPGNIPCYSWEHKQL